MLVGFCLFQDFRSGDARSPGTIPFPARKFIPHKSLTTPTVPPYAAPVGSLSTVSPIRTQNKLSEAMKKLLMLTALLLAGCDKPATRNFIGDITVGQPVWTNGTCFLPVDLPTRILHSAQWINKVDSSVAGTNILLTAHITKPPFRTKQFYQGQINLGAIRPGTYAVVYCDPQGTQHPIGTTTIHAAAALPAR